MVAGWKGRKALIFLDYEGVILVRGAQVPATSAIQALNTLLGQTGGEVVLSTAWRLNKTRGFMQDELREWGLTKVNVVGLLPHLTAGADPYARAARGLAVWFMLAGRLPIHENVFCWITSDEIPGPVAAGRVVRPKGVLFSGSDIAEVKACFSLQVDRLERGAKDAKEAAL